SAPPKKGAAAAHQRSTLEALGKAGLDAQRRSRNLRLSQVPTFAQLYLPPAAPAWGDPAAARPGDRLLQSTPGLPASGRLRARPAVLLLALAAPPTFAQPARNPAAEELVPALDPAIARGLAYLAKQQQPDGSFQNRVREHEFAGPKAALTGLAVMAYLSAGRTP